MVVAGAGVPCDGLDAECVHGLIDYLVLFITANRPVRIIKSPDPAQIFGGDPMCRVVPGGLLNSPEGSCVHKVGVMHAPGHQSP